MALKRLLLAAVLIFTALAPAADARVVRIGDDMGGLITRYLAKYHRIARRHDKVILTGDCVSACTLVLMLPKSQVCAMPRVRLGFHAVSDDDGSMDAPATYAFFENYFPREIANWILSLPLTLRVRYRSAASVGIAPCPLTVAKN